MRQPHGPGRLSPIFVILRAPFALSSPAWDKAKADHPEEVRVAKALEKGPAAEVDPKNYGFGGLETPVIRSTRAGGYSRQSAA